MISKRQLLDKNDSLRNFSMDLFGGLRCQIYPSSLWPTGTMQRLHANDMNINIIYIITAKQDSLCLIP